MTIKVNAGALSSALNFVGQAYSKNSPMEVLSNVSLTAEGGTLTILLTNLETEIKFKIDEQSESNEKFLIEFSKLKDRASMYKEDQVVTISNDEPKKKAKVKCGRSTMTLNTESYDQYPMSVFSIGDVVTATVDSSSFKDAVNRVKNVQGMNDVRKYLNGTHFEMNGDGTMDIVATDGHRLNTTRIGCECEDKVKGTIPRGSVPALLSFVDVGDLLISVSDRAFMVANGFISVSSKLIDSQYPNWEAIIPSESPDFAEFNADDLKSAVKASLITANEKNRGISITIDNGACSVSSYDVGSGSDIAESFDCFSSFSSIDFPFEMGINGKYVLDAISVIEEGNIKIFFMHGQKPLLIKEGDLRSVIMPMRL